MTRSKDAAALIGDEAVVGLPAEGDVLLMEDHDGERIHLRVQDVFESDLGPAVRGHQVKQGRRDSQGVYVWEYIAQRAMPLSMRVNGEEEAAAAEAKKETRRASARNGRALRTGGGFCVHCGEPTKGGLFLAGHDAKLKGDLKREATQAPTMQQQAAAVAEGRMRAALSVQGTDRPATSSPWWIMAPADVSKAAEALAAQGEAFLASRVATRTGRGLDSEPTGVVE